LHRKSKESNQINSQNTMNATGHGQSDLANAIQQMNIDNNEADADTDDADDLLSFFKTLNQKTELEPQQKKIQDELSSGQQNNQEIRDKHQKNQSSFVVRQLFGLEDANDIELNDPKARDKAQKEQRKKSRQLVIKHVGDKGHLSDEDAQVPSDEKPQRYDYNNSRQKNKNKGDRRKNSNTNPIIEENQESDNDEHPDNEQNQTNEHHKSQQSQTLQQNQPSNKNDTKQHHQRKSSIPVPPNMHFKDPDVELHFEHLKLKDLQKELERKLDELDETKKKVSIMEIDASQFQKSLQSLAEAKNTISKTNCI